MQGASLRAARGGEPCLPPWCSPSPLNSAPGSSICQQRSWRRPGFLPLRPLFDFCRRRRLHPLVQASHTNPLSIQPSPTLAMVSHGKSLQTTSLPVAPPLHLLPRSRCPNQPAPVPPLSHAPIRPTRLRLRPTRPPTRSWQRRWRRPSSSWRAGAPPTPWPSWCVPACPLAPGQGLLGCPGACLAFSSFQERPEPAEPPCRLSRPAAVQPAAEQGGASGGRARVRQGALLVWEGTQPHRMPWSAQRPPTHLCKLQATQSMSLLLPSSPKNTADRGRLLPGAPLPAV